MAIWQELLKQNITSIDALVKEGYMELSPQEQANMTQLVEQFPLSITRHYLSLIDKEDTADPLRKLFLPGNLEWDGSGEFDTSGECENTKVNGLQHKYGPTGLMLSTNQCAAYCRFCFRKRLVGLTNDEIAKRIDDVVAYVKEHKEIDNVLISGGDALMNSNAVLERLLEELTSMEHIRFIRMGSRMLAVLPQRVLEAEFLDMMQRYCEKKQIYLIAHFDHPREMTPESMMAIRALREAGVALKNQTVLMRGINDAPEVLAELMQTVNMQGIAPYYLFQCRPVRGVKAQFQVPFAEGVEIVNQAKRMLAGPEKQFRFALSHKTGKIEILGKMPSGELLFKYHQAKYEADQGRIFTMPASPTLSWLPEDGSF